MFRAAIITASDKGYAGEREDVSGPVIRELLMESGYEVVGYTLLPDERAQIAAEMARIADTGAADLILSTGGTGFSPRDCTPEATLDIGEKLVPGIPEAMRYTSMQVTGHAMLSRAAAVIRKETLIVNLPGSPKAVRECLEAILPFLSHGLGVPKSEEGDCAAPR